MAHVNLNNDIKLLMRDDLKGGLEKLLTVWSGNDNELQLLLSQLAQANEAELQGLVSHEEANRVRVRVAKRSLELVDQYTDSEPSFIKLNQLQKEDKSSDSPPKRWLWISLIILIGFCWVGIAVWSQGQSDPDHVTLIGYVRVENAQGEIGLPADSWITVSNDSNIHYKLTKGDGFRLPNIAVGELNRGSIQLHSKDFSNPLEQNVSINPILTSPSTGVLNIGEITFFAPSKLQNDNSETPSTPTYIPSKVSKTFQCYGRVIDKEGKAKPGLSIYIEELKMDQLTDPYGRFQFDIPQKFNDTLVHLFITNPKNGQLLYSTIRRLQGNAVINIQIDFNP